MPKEVTAEIEALRDASHRLENVSDFLHARAMSREIELRKVEAGSDDIVDAFNHFHSEWSDARSQIRKAVDDARGFLAACADTFEQLDDELTKGLTGG